MMPLGEWLVLFSSVWDFQNNPGWRTEWEKNGRARSQLLVISSLKQTDERRAAMIFEEIHP